MGIGEYELESGSVNANNFGILNEMAIIEIKKNGNLKNICVEIASSIVEEDIVEDQQKFLEMLDLFINAIKFEININGKEFSQKSFNQEICKWIEVLKK